VALSIFPLPKSSSLRSGPIDGVRQTIYRSAKLLSQLLSPIHFSPCPLPGVQSRPTFSWASLTVINEPQTASTVPPTSISRSPALPRALDR